MKAKRDFWVKCMPLTFSTSFGSIFPLYFPGRSQRDAAEHSTGNLLKKALLLCMKETLCAILVWNQNKHAESIHLWSKGRDALNFRKELQLMNRWESEPVDEPRDIYVTHLQSSQSQQLLLFGCKRELSQARDICRKSSKVLEKDANGAASSENAELL